MKKVLFVTLALAVAMTGFAQRNFSNATKTAKKPSALRVMDGSAIEGIQFEMPHHMVQVSRDKEEWGTMTTNYDLQSNSALGNRMTSWPDGSVATVATWDHSGSTSFPDRGAGYNFYDGSSFGDEPEVRQEPMKSGWPSICAYGDGELLASHATGVNLYYRPTKGQGEWTLLKNWGADYGSPTWPRVVVSGPNNEYIHVVMCKQIAIDDGYDNHVYYTRSTDGGQTWSELVDFPGVDNTADGDYRNQLSADDYVMSANGNNVACMFSAYTTEVFYMISHDNGETWERQIVVPYPYPDENGNPLHAVDFDDWPIEDQGMIDTISTGDNSHCIVIDDNGVVHVAFGLFHWRVTGGGYYTYYPAGYYGIVYWNSNYVNEQGGHEILPFGQSSIDAAHQAEWGSNHLGWTLHPDRVDELSNLDGNQGNLHIFGYIDEGGSGYENVTGASWHYRSLGLCTMPAISINEDGSMAIIYSVWSEIRVCGDTGFSYRSAYVTLKDNGGTWFDDCINLSEDFVHEYEEQYPCWAAPKAYDGAFWVAYSGDENQGLYLDISDSYPNSNMGVLTENYIYAVKIVPDLAGWGTEEKEAVNPMTSARVYPNPASDELFIEVNASQNSDMSISVYNIMGQKVMEQNATVSTGINRPSINVSNLTDGIYFVTIKANGFENTMKFIVK